MKSIEVSDITKTYNGRTVVDRLSFSVDKGEVFGLLGHNGAGKSTTIDCLLGLTKPDSGSARILGQNAAKHRKTLFEHVGVQLQHAAHANNIRVCEVCEETAALYHEPADYHALLKQFQLEAFTNQKVEQLSGGEAPVAAGGRSSLKQTYTYYITKHIKRKEDSRVGVLSSYMCFSVFS